MTRKQRRGVLLGVCLAVLGVAVGLVLYAMRDSIVFFYSPSEVTEMQIAPGQRFRLGGLVETGSVVRGEGTTIRFVVTDRAKTLPRERFGPTACFMPTACSPSTTRITCRRKSPRS